MKKKIFKSIWIGIKSILIIFLILFCFVICLQRFFDNSVSFFGLRIFSVATGSMQPVYKIGDIIICKNVNLKELKVGDDISYLGLYSSYKDKIITHRIIDINQTDSGELTFVTKGIAASKADPIVTEKQVYGKIIRKSSVLSWIYKTISTQVGFYLCIFIPLVILIGSEIVQSMVESYTKKRLQH